MTTATIDINEKEQIKKKAAKPLLGVGIMSIVMLFAGLTSAYIVRQAQGDWLEFELPSGLYISTVIIFLSSLSLIWASISLKKGYLNAFKQGLGITLFLAVGFIISQFIVWEQLVRVGVFFGGSGSNPAGSFLYVLTGLHLAHLIGGIVALVIVFVSALLGKYSPDKRLGFQLFEIYWHFLGGLWIYLLLFLLFIH